MDDKRENYLDLKIPLKRNQTNNMFVCDILTPHLITWLKAASYFLKNRKDIIKELEKQITYYRSMHSKESGLVWFVRFYGISTFVGYLTPNPFLCK